jgi:hypothetical protein
MQTLIAIKSNPLQSSGQCMHHVFEHYNPVFFPRSVVMVHRSFEQTISIARSNDESGAFCLLELRVRIPLGGAIMSIFYEC